MAALSQYERDFPIRTGALAEGACRCGKARPMPKRCESLTPLWRSRFLHRSRQSRRRRPSDAANDV